MTALTGAAQRAVTWLATQPGDYDPSSGRGPDWGKAAPIGLLIILLLGVALFFLIKSMNKNLRRVPASFDTPGSATAGAEPGTAKGTDEPDSSAATSATRTGPAGPEDPPTTR